MPVDPARLWAQVEQGGDSEIELKEVVFRGARMVSPRRDSLADELAAFANTDGGRLVLGVTDRREPQALTPEQLDIVVKWVDTVCADSVKPPLDYRLYRVPTPAPPGGAVVVDVREGVAVHRSPGGYFHRRGEAKREMLEADIRRLSHARGQSDSAATDSQIVRGTGVRSLSRDLWRRYASSRVDDPADVTLTKLKFVKQDAKGVSRATVGGLLLASTDPREWLPNAWIQAVSYRGTSADAARQLDALDISGPLDEQVRQAMRFVARNRRVSAYKDPARTDVPQFSDRAVFEALVNAVVHRDYAVSGSKIRLFMFEDRLELYSPGGLCNSMTPEDLRSSQFTRNELLASRLGQCDATDVPGAGGRKYFIERRGEGIAVIQDETFALAGEPPVIELLGARELRVVLPAARPPAAQGVGASVTVVRADTGAPLPGVHVLMVYPNKTYRDARTDAFGRAEIVLHARLPMTVLCAAEGFSAFVEREHVPDGPLRIAMRPAPEGGSMVIPHQAGHLPGIEGRLNPILDRLDRTYLYAHNVAINDGETQPVQFALNEPVRLTDSLGASATVWFREMAGSSCAFDYRFERR